MNHLSLDNVIDGIEMRDFERADGLDGGNNRLIGGLRLLRAPKLLSSRTQRPQHLGAIEPLALTMVAEAHRR